MSTGTPWQQDLKAIQKSLVRERARTAQQTARKKQWQRQAESDNLLFQRAMAGVTPLPNRKQSLARGQANTAVARPLPIARQRVRDEQAALQESLSDDFDAGTLLFVDELLSFRRHGIGPDVPFKLRRGQWAVQAEMDLHGLTRDEARQALVNFLARAHKAGQRCVRIIHGKGLGSPGRIPVLKTRVPHWLMQKKQVLAFVQAAAPHGGAGAVLVLLARRHPRQQ